MLCSLEFWANKLGEAVHLFSTLKRGRVEFAAPCQAARPVDIPAAPSSLPHIFHHPARPRLEPAHQRAAAAAALALDPLPKTCSTPAPARESSTFLFYPQQPPSSHHSPPDSITIFRLAGRRNEKRDPHAVSFARPRRPTTNEHSPRPTTTRPAPASRLPPSFPPRQRNSLDPAGQYSSAPSKMAPAAMSGMPGTKMHDDIDTTCVPALPSPAPWYPAGRLRGSRF